jgi:hypothetical protein
LGAGALVGRVGNSQPFAIGGSRDLIVMPADGELYLGVNDSGRGDNSGSFTVRVIPDNRYVGRPGGTRGAGYGQGGLAGAASVRVDARQEWTPTGMTVRQGERIAFYPTGQIAWGQGASQVAGAEGIPMDAAVRRNYPVPSAGVGALVGRIDNGAPFLVGAGAEPIVMPAGGQLYLGVNDAGRGDNKGAFQVRVTRDTRSVDQSRGGSGQDQVDFANAASVRVDARQDWTPTDVTVRQGERVAFQATGQIAWGQAVSQVAGPEGAPMDASARHTYPVPSAGVGALVGRIGNGVPFLVGASSEPIIMPAGGRLYLGVNDSSRGDNSGFFVVRIALVRR